MRKLLVLVALLIATLPPCAVAEEDLLFPGNRYVKTTLVADRNVIQPAESPGEHVVRLGVQFDVEPGWHIYWENSGESGSPTSVSWSLPQGWRSGSLRWPSPQRFIERGDIVTFGYNQDVLLTAKVFAPVEIPANDEAIDLSANVRWLVCSDICVPGQSTVSLELPYSSSKPLEPSLHYTAFETTEKRSPQKIDSLDRDITIEQLPTNAILGKSSTGYLLLRGLSQTDLAASLQFFPRAHAELEIGRPRIASIRGDDKASLLSFPIHTGASAPLGKTSLDGILVFSPAIVDSDNPISVDWKLPLEIVSTSPDKSSMPVETTGNPVELNYLVHSYQDKVGGTIPAKEQSSFARSLLLAMVTGFVAGLILNLMPCVLPIISIKIFSFLKDSHRPRGEILRNAWAFAAGVQCSFLALAIVVIAIRALGHSIGWGFQFQYPGFVFVLVLIVFTLSLSFFNLYSFKLPFLQQANRAAGEMQPSLLKNFFDGILVTALSTPCTAPFLGTALAFAFTQPPLVTIAVFLSIGAGLALPYAHLSTHPKLLERMPKPGDWMYRVRSIMGFLLLGTVLWLLFVLDQLTENGTVWAVIAALAIYLAIYLTNRIGRSNRDDKTKHLLRVGTYACAIIALFLLWPLATQSRLPSSKTSVASNNTMIDWQAFSPRAIADAKLDERPVFVDFTAEWCVTCKFNEKFAIETEAVRDLIKEFDILALKADWTDGDPVITEALNQYGGQGVPLYVLIGPGKDVEPVVLPTILTTGIVTSTIQETLGQ